MATFDLTRGSAVRWTPDGQALTVVEADKEIRGTHNIWLQPINGEPRRQLTNFSSLEIWTYAWSQDGKQLICSRGNQSVMPYS